MKLRLLSALTVLLAAASARADFEVYFMRHGETTWNRAHVLQGAIAYTELTPRGVAMAQETGRGFAANGLTFDRLFVSPLKRARDTALHATQGTGLVPTVDPRLCEMRLGVYEGKRNLPGCYTDDNIRRFYEDTDSYRPNGAGAESFDQLRARVRDFCETVLRPLDGKVTRVLCVSHAIVLRAVLMEYYGAGGKPIQPNCCVHVLRYSDGRFTVTDRARTFYDAKNYARPVPRKIADGGDCDIVKLDLRKAVDGVIVTRLGSSTVGLAEALPTVRHKPEFLIEFKGFDRDFAERAIAEFDKAKIDHSRIMVVTSDSNVLGYFREKHPEIRAGIDAIAVSR